jgi:taurine dioxygenase
MLSGVRLNDLESAGLVDEIRQAWLTHQVVSFADQPLAVHELERFTLQLGDFGHDPFVQPLPEHQHILEVKREANETVAPFGSGWHSDWSFQAQPPSATILHAKLVPKTGGDTLFADGRAAFATLEPGLSRAIEGLTAVHSARRPYSHQGFRASGGERRSMRIVPSDSALATQEHPIVRTHPETGRQALWVNPVYTVTIKGLSDTESADLLARLFAHYLQDKFIYRLRWSSDMLTLWDNRSVVHRALGGYDGQRRSMYRTTIAGDTPYHVSRSAALDNDVGFEIRSGTADELSPRASTQIG